MKIDAKEFLESLDDYEKTVDELLEEALVKFVLAIERDAKKNLTNSGAVDSGRLRMSIYTDVSAIKNKTAEIGTDLSAVGPRKRRKGPGVSTGVEYAPDVEYGTKHMSARPFMRPAFNQNLDKFEKNVSKILGGKK